MRQARRLMAGSGEASIRAGFALERRIVTAAQRSGPFWLINLSQPARKAEYLAAMGEARRAGDKATWRDARGWLNIWTQGGNCYPWDRIP